MKFYGELLVIILLLVANGRIIIIKNVKKIYDVSAVSLPANNATEISARSLAEGVAAEAKAERLERLNIDKLKLKILLEMEG